MASTEEKTIFLPEEKYNLWFHSNNTNYGEETFENIVTVKNIYEFSALHKQMMDKTQFLLKSELYFMKNDIKPIWSNDNHINGGTLSWKIDKNDAVSYWENLIFLYLTNGFSDLEKYNITGISINPRKGCNILKIWFNKIIPDEELNNIELPDMCKFKEKPKMFKTFKKFLEN